MAQNRPSLTILKQYLKNSSKEELMGDILELVKRFDSVKDYYQVKLYPQEQTQIIEKYKQIIEHEFFPPRGFGRAKISVAKKAITEYKKMDNNPVNIADIMLFYVEQGVRFTNAYGDIDEPFYNSMESMYEKVVEWIFKYEIQDLFKERCEKIVKETSGIGWGFHDALRTIYFDTFETE